MLKADAYGHGALEIARIANEYVDYYGVANAEEGVYLRHNGITKPILITVYSSCDSRLIATNNLTPIIYDIKHAIDLNYIAAVVNKPIGIHIKIDTGMNRLGIKCYDELNKLIDTIKGLPNIRLEGLCTHYYDNDVINISKQNAIFERFVYDKKNLLLHSASSNAMLIDSKCHYDMVRIGIAAYGYSEASNYYQPVMSVISKVIEIKKIRKGEGSGYNHMFKPHNDTTIAVIRGGYYDGITRNMVGCNVIINCHLCPIVAVCMDISMVEIGNNSVKVDDDVIVMGTMSQYKNTAIEIARHTKSIPYEVLTNIKGRIERIYYE